MGVALQTVARRPNATIHQKLSFASKILRQYRIETGSTVLVIWELVITSRFAPRHLKTPTTQLSLRHQGFVRFQTTTKRGFAPCIPPIQNLTKHRTRDFQTGTIGKPAQKRDAYLRRKNRERSPLSHMSCMSHNQLLIYTLVLTTQNTPLQTYR